jgi:hypothetical protein
MSDMRTLHMSVTFSRRVLLLLLLLRAICSLRR